MELSTTVGLERVLFACRAGGAGAAGAYLARTSYVDRPSRGSKASLPKSLWRTRSRQREAAVRIGIGIIVVVALAPTVVLTKASALVAPVMQADVALSPESGTTLLGIAPRRL